MSRLQVKRATDAVRLETTPESGEPFWTTDTTTFYVGDGTTVGGVPVSGGSATAPDIFLMRQVALPVTLNMAASQFHVYNLPSGSTISDSRYTRNASSGENRIVVGTAGRYRIDVEGIGNAAWGEVGATHTSFGLFRRRNSTDTFLVSLVSGNSERFMGFDFIEFESGDEIILGGFRNSSTGAGNPELTRMTLLIESE